MSVRLLTGDCRQVLAALPDASVQCVVTSPPYYGLRDYGVAGQIGLEASVDEYVAEMVAVFREVRRVLRDDGTLWLNLGDSYAAGHGGSTTAGNYTPKKSVHNAAQPKERPDLPNAPAGWAMRDETPKRVYAGMKPKDLLGIPWRVAFALQADGWYLRSDIIWSKPNPMPESVRDRPTKAHEYVFLMSKSARYFFDADAVKESSEMNDAGRRRAEYSGYDAGAAKHRDKGSGNGKEDYLSGSSERYWPATRNIRSVWTIATHPYAEAHFATFPPDLAERCIKAGTNERGACAACGAAWVRVVSDGEKVQTGNGRGPNAAVNPNRHPGEEGVPAFYVLQRDATGWAASCCCEPEAVTPCVVLDPFAGAGTVSLVAERLGRDSIGIELNGDYVAMAADRIRSDCPMFAAVEVGA